MKNGKEMHDFYCIKCGNKNFALSRSTGHKYSKHHMKKLWCWHCKEEINCVECSNDEEVEEFKRKFEAGEFQKDLEESLNHIQKIKDSWS